MAGRDGSRVDSVEGTACGTTRIRSPAAACSCDVTVVVDPFHIVRLANQAVTKRRQRVQQETFEHRGWKGDPLYDIRKLLLLGAERVDETGWERIHRSTRRRRPSDEVRDTWVAKEKVRDIYLTEDADQAGERLDDAIAWCTAPEAGPELRRLAKTLRRWRTQIVAHHHTGASNGPVEAANLPSSRSSDPAEGSATSPTTASGSCSPPASPARLNPSRDSEPDPGQPRRA